MIYIIKKALYPIVDQCTFKIRKFLKFFMETEKWSYEQFLDYQLEKLKEISKVWNLKIKTWEDFYSLPIMTKDDLPTAKPKSSSYYTHETSGSTGEPRVIYVPRETWYRKDAIFLRSWQRMGRKFEYVLRLIAGEPKYWWYDWFRNVNPMNYRRITEKHIDFVFRKKPYVIHGPGGAIRQLCEVIIKRGYADILKDIKIEWCSESSEGHKERLKKFVKEFHEQYGLAELPTVGSPDGYGNIRVVMETGVVEILKDDGTSCKEGEEGNIVVTDYNNYMMPIVRYKTGDRGKRKMYRSPDGREYPILYDIKGRGVDFYDGPEVKRPVGWWVVSPISHKYGHIISKWRVDIYPRQNKVVLNVVFRGKENFEALSGYKDWIKEELGLKKLEIVSHSLESARDWKHKLVKVYVE